MALHVCLVTLHQISDLFGAGAQVAPWVVPVYTPQLDLHSKVLKSCNVPATLRVLHKGVASERSKPPYLANPL
jgi:hypothetical protein